MTGGKNVNVPITPQSPAPSIISNQHCVLEMQPKKVYLQHNRPPRSTPQSKMTEVMQVDERSTVPLGHSVPLPRLEQAQTGI